MRCLGEKEPTLDEQADQGKERGCGGGDRRGNTRGREECKKAREQEGGIGGWRKGVGPLPDRLEGWGDHRGAADSYQAQPGRYHPKCARGERIWAEHPPECGEGDCRREGAECRDALAREP